MTKAFVDTPQRAQNEFARSNALWIALGVNVGLFSITYLVYAPKFQYNDDPMMMLLAAGVGRVVEPSIYLNFTHVWIGWMLKSLYQAAFHVPWYALYLIAALLAAHTAFLYLVIRRIPVLAAIGFFSAYFFLIGVNLLINLQFSIASVLLAAAGWVLLYSDDSLQWMSDEHSAKMGLNLRTVAALGLVAGGSMIRFDGMRLAFGLTAPMLVLCLSRRVSKRVFTAALLVALALGLCIGLDTVNRKLYEANPDSRGFERWNSSASQFLDYDAERRVASKAFSGALSDVGWSKNDFQIFKRWFYLDDELYSLENFEILLAALPSFNTHLTPARVFDQFSEIFEDPFVGNCLLIFGLMSLLVSIDSKSAGVLLLSISVVVALSVYLIYAAKPPPPRVYFSMFSYLAVTPMLLFAAGRYVAPRNLPRYRQVAVAVAGVLFCLAAVRTIEMNRAEDRLNRQVELLHRQFIEELDPQPEQIIWSWTGALAWHLISPFGDLSYLRDLVAPDTRLYPSTRRIMRNFQIEDAYLDLLTNDRAFLAIHAGSARKKLPRLRRYMIEHYGKNVTWTKVSTNRAFEVYKMSADPTRR